MKDIFIFIIIFGIVCFIGEEDRLRLRIYIQNILFTRKYRRTHKDSAQQHNEWEEEFEDEFSDDNVKITSLTAREALELSTRMKNNPNVIWRKTFIPEEYKDKIDPDTIWQKLYAKEIEERIEIIKNDIKESQYNTFANIPMIPLCVSYSDKDKVKKLGAVWDPSIKSWFWPFEENRKLVKRWLPKIYQSNLKPPYILPRLVPEPLWNLNLRLLLTKEQWDSLRKLTYEQSGHRCTICGCRGEKWPVECDEEWLYEYNGPSKPAMVYFKGLQSLCPSCHQVHHFGKARVDGYNDIAMARLMALNDWSSVSYAKEVVDKAFKEWEIRSSQDKWLFNSDVLEQKYGIYIEEKPYLKRVKELE